MWKYSALSKMLYLILFILICGCASDESKNWQSQEANGVNAKLPEGWVIVTEENGLIRIRGTENESIILWPVFIAGRLSGKATTELFHSLLRRVHRDAQWGTIERIRGNIIKTSGIRSGHRISASMVLQEHENQTGGILYVFSASQDSYPHLQNTFESIVKSVQIRGPVSRDEFKDPPRIEFVRLEDPGERAFKVSVPRGWNISGATDRYAAVDVLAWVRASDPSGDILVFFGDTNIPPFTTPNETLN